MKKKYIMTTAALMFLSAALTFCITMYASEREYNAKLADLSVMEQQYARISEVHGYIEKYYVNEYDEKELTDGALYGMVAMLGDQWSHYLTPEQFSSVLTSLNSTVVGIGINATYDSENEAILVLEVFEDSPAEYAKIMPRDRIISVDGKKVSDIGYEAATKSITGAVDTPVSLVISREGESTPINMSITRRQIDVPHVSSKILDGNIGYVKISSFESNVDKDVASALSRLQSAGVTSVIFDVRNNPGGMLQVLINTLDPLLPEGIIIQEVDKFGNATAHRSDAEALDLPMVVLTNQYSISAAEFFAAALQEAGKATIVGEPTTGKALVQANIPLKDGAGLVLSIKKYSTGLGKDLAQMGGITPDRIIRLTEEEQNKFHLLSQSEDRQLQEAIKVINEALASDDESAPTEEME